MAQVSELEAGTEWLRLSVDLERLAPADVWRAFTDPDRLVGWWPQAAEADVRVGGRYHFSWPAMGWDLRGEYAEVGERQRLSFSWAWDHEPDLPVREVTLGLEALPYGAGTRLTVTHGRYGGGPTEAADRASHLDGWRHSLARLAEL